MKKLILIRHGESIWNLKNRYTGWVDINLTEKGIYEANKARINLINNKLIPDIIFTSNLKRSIDTTKIIGPEFKNIYSTWRLNEKHYGNLSGYIKDKLIYSNEDYFSLPPFISKIEGIEKLVKKNKYYYPYLGESYYMTKIRVIPFLNLVKKLDNKCILICSHKNTMRIIIQILENLDNKDVFSLDIPNGVPIVYLFNKNMDKFFSKEILLK